MPPSSSAHLNHHSRGWRPGFVRPVRPSSKPVSSRLITDEASVQRKVWKAISQPHCTRNQGTIPSPIFLHKTQQGDTALSRCWHHCCFATVILALKESMFLHQAFLQGTRIARPSTCLSQRLRSHPEKKRLNSPLKAFLKCKINIVHF